MNSGSAASASSGSSAPSNPRRERGAIAAQACDTCRARKQKCDEQRPKCGLCTRMKLECNYREPQPTKKDRTLVEILDRLKSLEGKIDRIPKQPSVPAALEPAYSSTSQSSFAPELEQHAHSASTHSQTSDRNTRGRTQTYKHASAAHKMLTWPAIQDLLLHALPSNTGDLQSLQAEGSVFIVGIQKDSPTLPLDETLADRPFVGIHTQVSRTSGGPRVVFPILTREVMTRLSGAYFDTFNLLYPFLDRQTFFSETLIRVHSEGFDGDTESVISLLVFALGEFAIETSRGSHVNPHLSRRSSLPSVPMDRPPGLALFNEARKRMGFVLTDCELENVQIFSLAALYYGLSSRHVEFWRLMVSASLACQVLITCNTIDWNSRRGDLIKRAYWHCAIIETVLYLELDLPLNGIIELENQVGLPTFNGLRTEEDHAANEATHFEHHYAAQIALRRLCANMHSRFNDILKDGADIPAGPALTTLNDIAAQLEQFRVMLPEELQWPEDDPTAFPARDSSHSKYNQPVDPSLLPAERIQAENSLFSTHLDRELVQYLYAYDIQVALMRTRYYYAKYMVYRPFVYKALHFPEQMTQEDAEGVATCLKACLKWPITLFPTAQRKHLVPYLFCWSQNFLGVLLIFHMTTVSPILQQIRNQLCGDSFEIEAQESVEVMLDWIRDLRGVGDPVARWCADVLKGLYPLDQ